MASNADRVSAGIEIFRTRGMAGVLPLFAPDAVWVAPPEWMDKAEFVGHEGLMELEAVWLEGFDEFDIEPCELREDGDRVFALLVQRGRIHGGSAPIEQRIGWVVTFRAEDIVRICSYFSWEETEAAFRS